jgi:hypothetical protein
MARLLGEARPMVELYTASIGCDEGRMYLRWPLMETNILYTNGIEGFTQEIILRVTQRQGL